MSIQPLLDGLIQEVARAVGKQALEVVAHPAEDLRIEALARLREDRRLEEEHLIGQFEGLLDGQCLTDKAASADRCARPKDTVFYDSAL